MKVTIGIKALNEEKRIADALASAVAAVAPFGGEVVLADSGSTDRTIEIARQFPVRIVQLANPAERCCGAGAQLAFQSAKGEYFYLLDGDMVIDPGFLPAGIAYLEENKDVAAVGGHVRERNTQGHEFQIRANTVANDRNWSPGIVDRLDCGGLYRTSAVREAGWFADRNLHAFEEFELASRLQARGWKLARIDVPAIDHFGHTEDGYHLLLRRIRSGYSGAPGEVLRGAIGRSHLPIVLRRLGHVRNGLAVMAWWLLLLVALVTWHPFVLLGLILVPLAFLSWRRGSPRLGLYSLTAWNVSAAGLLAGFFRRRTPPDRPLGAIELKHG
ncbi:glycosyltransferase [Sphingosinicella sp. BN140058]|uniref:glycosyltransferase family 2 protein n=1 Tax=Sphingosinicella sp. BN140058 TaxID=1892855 RepID=UPI001010367C|nr:glycosyltransferase [Sphingosinicella sp. BN140058]QAY77487.1 glycosyltransferase [Sphingosinicella sp. BN140058]